ncbi:hypothetical protein BEN49_08005 [Hymenobacter coccineus]|uniref:Uncharacterized protein n=1 Tax=Hymenobacter coccineus TaxID=1908235 RepID=A0A1G1TGF8_9BACT|nr:hypothetical protein BEN49_08005 [Hymenobacter coccineus]
MRAVLTARPGGCAASRRRLGPPRRRRRRGLGLLGFEQHGHQGGGYLGGGLVGGGRGEGPGGEMVADEVGVELPAHESGVAQHVGPEAQRGFDARNLVLVDGAQHPGNGLGAVGPKSHQFGNHRVVVNRDFHALLEAVVDAHAGALGAHVGREGADVGQEVVLRVFGVHAQLQGVALDGQIFLAEGQGLALRDADLLLHQVEARDLLCHGVLHLQARVHLQEVKLVVFVEQKLYCAGPGVVAGAGHVHGRAAHFGA